MNLGFIVDSASNLKEYFNFAMEQGISYVEILCNMAEPYSLDPKPILEAMKETNVKVAACGLWRINTMSTNQEEFEKNQKIVFEFMDMAKEVGSVVAFIDAGFVEDGDTDANIRRFKEIFPIYKNYADERGLIFANYLGHGGNFIKTREILDRVVKEIPDFRIKLDPVGIMRNLKDDPYYIVSKYADKIAHFHAKDIYKREEENFEVETPVGQGQLKWNILLGMLNYVGYKGFVIIEPHGPVYGKGEGRKKHIILSKRHLEQFMI